MKLSRNSFLQAAVVVGLCLAAFAGMTQLAITQSAQHPDRNVGTSTPDQDDEPDGPNASALNQQPPTGAIPVAAVITGMNLSIPGHISSPASNLTMFVAQSRTDVFPIIHLEPTLVMIKAGDHVPSRPLYRADGSVDKSGLEKVDQADVTVEFVDYMEIPELASATRHVLNSSQGKSVANANHASSIPVSLECKDGNAMRILASDNIQPAAKQWKHATCFHLEAEDLKALLRSPRSDVHLLFQPTCRCYLTSSDVIGYVRTANTILARYATKLCARKDHADPVLFIAVGGDVDHEHAAEDLAMQVLEVEFYSRRGAKVGGTFLKNLFPPLLNIAADDVNLSKLDQRERVAWNLDNLIRIDAPIGKLRQVFDAARESLDARDIESLEKWCQEMTQS